MGGVGGNSERCLRWGKNYLKGGGGGVKVEIITVSDVLWQFMAIALIRFPGHILSNIKFWNLTISKSKCSEVDDSPW